VSLPKDREGGFSIGNQTLLGLFHLADEVRRQQGRALDCLGLGPRRKSVRSLRRWRAVDLLTYQDPNPTQRAVLIVPAPIKGSYIWDLAPGSSAVERLMHAGLQVYMAAWLRPGPGDREMGLGEYADRAIVACIEEIRARTGQGRPFLAGHSLGGTLAAIFASLHPARVRGLIELEGPIEFGPGRLEAAVARAPHAPAIGRWPGTVPGTFLDWSSFHADPQTFFTEPWRDRVESARSPGDCWLHWRVVRWTLDEQPMAARLFEEVVELLYRKNRFAEGGLQVGDRVADARVIGMPVIAVLDPRSRITPPQSIEAYRTRTASADVEILHYPGDRGVVMQHLGVLVGRTAHALLWPRIEAWLRQRAL
jgi:polyhydroxyalkanoate synthase